MNPGCFEPVHKGCYMKKQGNYLARVILLLAVILQSLTLSMTVSSVLFTLWAVANYYVIEYHGRPLFPSEFANTGAAMDVSGGYSLHVTRTILYLLAVFVLEVVLIIPSFVGDLPCAYDYSEEEAMMARRTVPFVIWSNRPQHYPENHAYASMTDLLPMIMRSTGLPESAYYRMILSLRDTLPVRTSYGRYRTMDGEIGIFKKSSPYYDLLQKYYYLEYNGLCAGDDYLREAFLPSRNTGS